MNFIIAKANGIDFELKQNQEGSYELPRLEKGGIVYIDGFGTEIKLRTTSRGFITPLLPGQSPLSGTSTTYIIKNLRIVGGKRAVDMFATFNSVIENLECIGQTEFAIKLSFSLMSRLQNIRITNPLGHGVWLGVGEDSWSTNLNSQCNHSVLDQVRVYNSKKTVGNSFTVDNSNGVKILNCVSEGHTNVGYAIDYRAQNSTVKTFLIDNFHVEGLSTKGAIRIDAQANTSNTVSRLFVQKYGDSIPTMVIKNNAPINLEKIGWWTPNMFIHSENFAPRIRINECTYQLNYRSLKTPHERGIFKPYIFVNGKNPR